MSLIDVYMIYLYIKLVFISGCLGFKWIIIKLWEWEKKYDDR